jgi:hypothetical protein
MIDRIEINTGLTSGGAGASTATGYSQQVSGNIIAVYIAYGGSPPAGTTDVTLQDDEDPASENIINKANSATAAKHYPLRLAQDNTGSNLTAIYTPYAVHGRLKLTIAQANDDDWAVATVWLDRQD